MAPVISPMQAHCRDIKRRYPDAKTVFIGPCISKKAEAESCRSDIDCVLTFEELSSWMIAEEIEFERVEVNLNGEKYNFVPEAAREFFNEKVLSSIKKEQ